MSDNEKRSRSAFRGLATKQITALGDLLKTTPQVLTDIKAKVLALNNTKLKLLSLDEIILPTLDDSSYVQDMEDSSERQESIDKQLLLAEIALKKLEDDVSSSRSDSSSKTNRNRKHLNLQRLSVQPFDGDYLKFTDFFNQFNSIIHNNDDLDPVEKFQYLRLACKGKAATLIGGFDLTESDYSQAYQLLKVTYDQSHFVIEGRLTKILNLKQPKATYAELSDFRAEMENHIRSLNSLGVDMASDSVSLTYSTIFAIKLPPETKAQMERNKPAVNWSLDTFRAALNKEILLLQENKPAAQTKPAETQNKGFKPNYSGQKPNYSNSNSLTNKPKLWYTANEKSGTVSNLNVSSTTPNTKQFVRKHPCCFCEGEHYPSSCEKYRTLDERRIQLINVKRCLKCLDKGHIKSNCMSKGSCSRCQGDHNRLICTKSQDNKHNPISNSKPENTASMSVSTRSSAGVALPTAFTMVYANNCFQKVRLLFDQGSQRTFCKRALVNSLQLQPIGQLQLSISGFNSEIKARLYDVVQFQVIAFDKRITLQAVVVEDLPSKVIIPGIVQAIRSLKGLKVRLADPNINQDEVTDISILIGGDQYFNFITNQKLIGGIRVLNSNLGHLIVGKLDASHLSQINSTVVTSSVATVLRISESCDSVGPLTMDSSADIEKLWSMDSIGININAMKNIDKKVLDDFEQSLKFENGKYVASLPWRPNHPPLSENFGLAKSRLYHTIKKLSLDPPMLKAYDDVIQEQLKCGYIIKVDRFATVHPDSKIHFLPHHGVKKDSATTPLRIVFDASSGKVSLNSCLYSGPPMVADLCQMLMRFRLNPYASSSDIEKAFLQIVLKEPDQESTRFLWLENPQDINSPLVTYKFRVVIFGATCSQFMLTASIKHHLEQNCSPVNSKLHRDLYIDNLISTFPNENQIIPFYQESTDTLSNAGLKLREWISNSPISNEVFRTNEDGIEKTSVKVLGMEWETTEDLIKYPNRTVDLNSNTKRKILSTTAGVFDPNGFLLPVTIRARLFLQKLWKVKLAWDDIIDSHLLEEWSDIAQEIQLCLNLTLPRQLIFSTDVTLHAFSDASHDAYGTTIYIVNNEHSNLVLAKAKVAPVKNQITIPKLELTAAVLSARLIAFTKEAYADELNIVSIHTWCDNQPVLNWIISNKLQDRYVQNRIDEINNLIPNTTWHYVPSAENPGDLLTHGISAKKFANNNLWLHGPTWLLYPEDWPTWTPSESPTASETVTVNIASNNLEINPLRYLIDKFSSLKYVYKITALVLRFISNLKNKIASKPLMLSVKTNKDLNHNFDNKEYSNVILFWIRIVQREVFQAEIDSLSSKSKSFTNLVKQWNLLLDSDGILKCNRRLGNASVDDSQRNPTLLPSRHRYTDLYIQYMHVKHAHASVPNLMMVIQIAYWFSKLRQRVKLNIRPCVVCKRLQGVHYSAPPAPDLPVDRIVRSRPFSVVGIDYTGALFVKNKSKLNKVYVVLFTCAVTRAVSLELVSDNTKDSFLFALRRFVSRNGMPGKIISDNATTFAATADYLRTIQQRPSVQQFLNSNNILWQFIPARSPHFGGFYERLIGVTKMSLKKILGNAIVTREELTTIVAEVELIMNTRPLTYVSDNFLDDPALSPSDLLRGYNLRGLPTPLEDLEKDPSFNEQFLLSKRQRHLSKLIEHFWQRWHTDYLVNLRQHALSRGAPQLNLGDIVLISENCTRLKWKLGRIVTLHQGPDGYIRSVSLKTNNGTVTRAIIKLYPLEIGSSMVPTVTDPIINSEVRPIRQAAVKARRLCNSQLN